MDYGLSANVNDGITAKGRTDNWIDPGTTRIKGSAISTGDFTAFNSISLGSPTTAPKEIRLHTGSGFGDAAIMTATDYGGMGPAFMLSASKVVIGDNLFIGTSITTNNRVLTIADVLTARFG